MLKIFNEDNEIQYDINEYLLKVFPLENFSAFGFSMDGVYFPTGEHAFQYYKYLNEEIRDRILKCSNPYDARELGRKYKNERVPYWNDIKYDYLEKIFNYKVLQNKMVKDALLATKDFLICEYCIDQDTEWGLDENGNGENRLGKAWMNVRKRIR